MGIGIPNIDYEAVAADAQQMREIAMRNGVPVLFANQPSQPTIVGVDSASGPDRSAMWSSVGGTVYFDSEASVDPRWVEAVTCATGRKPEPPAAQPRKRRRRQITG